jgi:hypothetical protein
MKSIKLFFVLLTAVTVAACGSGSGTTTSPLPHTTATMSFSASATGSAPTAPLQGIEMTVRLPQGTSIADATTAVVGKGGHVPQNIIYSAPDNTITFSLIDAEIKLGETFVDVTCTIIPGATLTAASFSAVNSPLPFLNMVGVNPATGTTVDLVPQINIAMAVTFR